MQAYSRAARQTTTPHDTWSVSRYDPSWSESSTFSIEGSFKHLSKSFHGSFLIEWLTRIFGTNHAKYKSSDASSIVQQDHISDNGQFFFLINIKPTPGLRNVCIQEHRRSCPRLERRSSCHGNARCQRGSSCCSCWFGISFLPSKSSEKWIVDLI